LVESIANGGASIVPPFSGRRNVSSTVRSSGVAKSPSHSVLHGDVERHDGRRLAAERREHFASSRGDALTNLGDCTGWNLELKHADGAHMLRRNDVFTYTQA
jgi:hypothetical protein